ncbi:MAG: Riboflavin biosynthesis protein RibD [Phycisphaerae bacterium]|nr:Riboflavin biosynthesis protein RibD [Phycisphaerae bacterium]
MKRALRLARRGLGRVEPNPMVGCVLVKNGRLMAEGYHHYFGGPHAEIDALRKTGSSARGATAYITLEPCNHFGKTPPCTVALIAAGIRRVVAATIDPHPQVAGRGLQRLQQAGLDASSGLLSTEAQQLIRPYTTLLKNERPYVIAKWAQSLDGRLATRTGESRWISSPPSRHYVQQLRSRVDAILVGVNTILADNPQLTCRLPNPRRRAWRIILDSRLRTPITSHVARTARRIPTWIFTSTAALRSRRVAPLMKLGVQIAAVPHRRNQLSLPIVLKHLAQHRLTNLLVEGGGEVLGSFFDEQFIDEICVFIAPRLIGGKDAPTALAGRGLARITSSLLNQCQSRRLGDDWLIQAQLPPSSTLSADK